MIKGGIMLIDQDLVKIKVLGAGGAGGNADQ